MIVLRLAGDLLVILSAIAMTAAAVLYGLMHRVWRGDPVARHLAAFMVALAAVLDLATLGVALRWAEIPLPLWFQVLRLVVFVAVPAVAGWRLWLVATAYARFRRSR